MSDYVPLSVEHGNRRKKLGCWLKGCREAVAVRLAPWLDTAQQHRDIAKAWREVATANHQLSADGAELQSRGRAMLAEAGYEDAGCVVVGLTPEEARSLWLAYKAPVGDNAVEHMQSAEDKLCRALKALRGEQ